MPFYPTYPFKPYATLPNLPFQALCHSTPPTITYTPLPIPLPSLESVWVVETPPCWWVFCSVLPNYRYSLPEPHAPPTNHSTYHKSYSFRTLSNCLHLPFHTKYYFSPVFYLSNTAPKPALHTCCCWVLCLVPAFSLKFGVALMWCFNHSRHRRSERVLFYLHMLSSQTQAPQYQGCGRGPCERCFKPRCTT